MDSASVADASMMHTTESMTTSRAARGWSLVSHGDGEVLPLRAFPCRVGRQPGLPVRLVHPTVSLVHAELRLSGDELTLVDMGSRNGTFINGRRLTGSHAVVLGDLLQFGAAVFRLHNEQRTCVAQTSSSEDMGDLALAIAQFDKLIEDQVVVPHYQPIVTAATGQIIGFEALARSRLFGLDNPAMMFKAAEFFQKEAELSRLLRTEALRRSGMEQHQHLFLNTHPAELLDLRHLIISLQEIRKLHPSQALTLEVHEACAVDAATIRMLRLVLDDLGMRLAYDDFGAGQARLHELVEARPDYLKFDRKLIASIDTARADRQQMLESLVQMTRQLGVTTLAEGIETQAEADTCRRMGFELMQGYFFGRPIAHPAHSPVLHAPPPAHTGGTTISVAKPDSLTERMAKR
jgi:EAL domain-containing protein (putative c-di-GMP-specific phosphodiesterase class I)